MTTEPKLHGSSPWGLIDYLTRFERDGALVAVSVSTPSHGGFWVHPDAIEAIPEQFRATRHSSGGWFEEDCDWSIPYLFCSLGAIDPNGDHTEDAQRTFDYWIKRKIAALG